MHPSPAPQFPDPERQPRVRPGDVVFTHRSGPIPRLISLAQRRQFGPIGHWTHCAMVIDEQEHMVEAESTGVRISPLDKYHPGQFEVASLNDLYPAGGQNQAVAYARAQVGKAFGFLDLFSVGVWLLTGKRMNMSREDHQICSGLVAHAIQEGGLAVPDDPTFTLPAQLATALKVPGPAGSGAGPDGGRQ